MISDAAVSALDCAGAACTAYAESGAAVRFSPGGGSSTVTPIDTGVPLNGLACPSESQCTAIDARGHALTFAPTAAGTPTPTTIDATGVRALACATATRCVGNESGLSGSVVSFDPTAPVTPTPVRIDGTQFMLGIACSASSRCTTVDGSGMATTFDPATPGTPAPTPTSLLGHTTIPFDIACPSVTRCVTVGLDQTGPQDVSYRVTFDPATPSGPSAPLDGVTSARSVACPTSTQCTAVDDAARVLTFDPSSSGTPTSQLVSGEKLTGIACPTATDCVAVDAAGEAIEGNPQRTDAWVTTRLPNANSVVDVACPTATTCVVVDNAGHGFSSVATAGGGGGGTGGGGTGGGESTAPGSGSTPAAVTPIVGPVPPRSPGVTLPTVRPALPAPSRLRALSRAGRVLSSGLRFTCPARGAACRLSITATAKHGKKSLRLVTTSKTLPAGKSAEGRVTLTKATLKRLTRALPARVNLTLTLSRPGATSATATVRGTFKRGH